MKRRIFLFRHAKSSWSDKARDDHERDLAARGREAAGKMGEWCAGNGVVPELVLCSTARRARETVARLLPRIKAARIEFEDGLYMAEPGELLARLRKLPDGVESVMLVGHNPGLHHFALLLAGDGDEEDLARLRAKFPTAALADFTLDLARWRDLQADQGRLMRFIVPRELP